MPTLTPASRTTPSAPALALELLLLGAVLAIALVLGWRVIGQLPVPGDDWAKYLLYADEIRRHGTLALQNELWMGGRPFSEDPGIASLEGSALLMTGAPAGALVRVILLLTLLQVAAAFGAARAQLGLTAATVTALLIAVVPASQNILGWHGLANAAALAIMPLVLAQLGAWLAGDLDRRAEVGLAITMLGVAAAHRFTALFLAGTLLLVIAAGLTFGPARRAMATQVLRTAGWSIGLGLLLIVDLRRRASESGGTLPYTSYLGTKVDLSLAMRDLTWLLVGVAVASVIVLLARRQLPRVVWPALALALVSIALGVSWIVHLPLYYSRVTFFLPLPLAVLAGAGAAAFVPLVRERGQRARVAALTAATALAVATLVTGLYAWRQAEEVRLYYAFASPQSIAALDDLAPQLRPGEIVATDRCWSFLATWLLHTRTYPALEEQDIQPKAELVVARRAAAILRGTAEGRRLSRELPVRFAIVDPTCPVTAERFHPPGTLLYAGDRMAIVQLERSDRR